MTKISKKVLMRHLHRANKMYANREPQTVNQLRNQHGGTHWFYYKLAAAGHLSKINGKYVWSGGKLNKKSIKPILQSLSKHRKKINDNYISHSPLTINRDKLKKAKVALKTAIDNHVASRAPLSPTIGLFIGAIEQQIQAHRANGESQIHLENIVKLTRDMEKIMD